MHFKQEKKRYAFCILKKKYGYKIHKYILIIRNIMELSVQFFCFDNIDEGMRID